MIDKVIKINRKDYDEVISLGGSCSAASQLKHRGKRKCSYPLDWTWMTDTRPVLALPELVRTRFANHCRYENMFEFAPPHPEYKEWMLNLEDKATGYRHIHSFNTPFSDRATFERGNKVIRRRIDRMYKAIENAEHVLLVLATGFTCEDKDIEAIYRAFTEVFPKTDIEIVNIQFASDHCAMYDICGGQVHVAKFERQLNQVYDNQLTTHEWSFMDGITVKGVLPVREVRKKNLKIKWMYKLWRWLGNRLEAANAGCANMRFRVWKEY